jgi:hypothetical protein
VVKADTPTVTVTEGNEQYCAPWIVESPGGTVTTSAYHDEKKRCLSAEGGSGDPRKKVFLNKTKPSRGLIAKDIASAKTRSARKPTSVKRRCAARPVRRKWQRKRWHSRSRRAFLKKQPRVRLQRGNQARPSAQQKKPRARLQRGKQARSSAQQKKPRWAATGQAGKDKHTAVEAARWAATGPSTQG